MVGGNGGYPCGAGGEAIVGASAVTSLWFKVSADNFDDIIRPAKVIVLRRPVTLKSGTQEWVYDTLAHSNLSVTVESGSFVGGEGIATNDFATITEVGTRTRSRTRRLTGRFSRTTTSRSRRASSRS